MNFLKSWPKINFNARNLQINYSNDKKPNFETFPTRNWVSKPRGQKKDMTWESYLQANFKKGFLVTPFFIFLIFLGKGLFFKFRTVLWKKEEETKIMAVKEKLRHWIFFFLRTEKKKKTVLIYSFCYYWRFCCIPILFGIF